MGGPIYLSNCSQLEHQSSNTRARTPDRIDKHRWPRHLLMLTANPFGGPGVSWITRRVSYRPRGVHRFKNMGQTTSGVKCVDVEYMGWGKLYRPIGSSNESTDDQFGIRFREASCLPNL